MVDSAAPNVVALSISGDAKDSPTLLVQRAAAPWRVDGFNAVAVRIVSSVEHGEACARWTVALPQTLARARPARIRTFLTGRYCAELALVEAGLRAPRDVGFGEDRAPIWPRGYVGSITHTDDFAGAVVAPANQLAGIGIDSESLLTEADARELGQTVAPELDVLNFVDLGAEGFPDEALLMSVVFSAKESIYKCLHPTVREFFEFSDVSVTSVDRRNGSMRAVLNRALGALPAGRAIDARFVVTDRQVHTSVVLPAGWMASDNTAAPGTSE